VTQWSIYKIASTLVWLGRVHAVDEAEAMAKALPNTASPHNASSPKPLSMVYRKVLVLFADRHQGHLCLCSRRRTQCCCSECRSEGAGPIEPTQREGCGARNRESEHGAISRI